VTSSVTWPFDSPYAISYWYFFETESLSPAVFEILRSKRIEVTSLTFQGHVTSSVTWPFESPYPISYWWSFGTESLNPTVSEILRSKRIGVTSLTFQGHVTSSVTWPFDSPMPFPIGTSLKRSLYLQPFSRYCALIVLGSRVWPFKVTWRRQSRDNLIAHMPFPIGGPLEPNLYF